MVLNVQKSIFAELADFMVAQPTLEEIVAYKVSSGVQQYIDDLLERNREEGLSASERLELEKILAVIQMMDVAKAKAQLKLANKE
ncbi:MAG: hypothetical protein H6670_12715 [Anaerolineaceae bacterium]|nr:hypothetical protein [Anaerolineae bacterium]MCB9460506.1 hypothetical protein [Anaerolineaceae bacterium]